MFERFKSQARREREAVRDAVVDAILKSEAAAKAEIHLLETAVEPAQRSKAMSCLVDVLLRCERTEKDVAIWQARADSLKAKGQLHDALGTNMGTRLAACGVLLLHLQGKELRAATVPFARLEALLRAQVARHGVDPWPVAYLDHMEFEKYRLAHPPTARYDDAVPSTQPETSTMAFVSTTLPPEL
jgi:hypothetical protein